MARAYGRVAWLVARHPSLWAVAVIQVRRLAARGWWHRWPFLPLPSRAYMRFRLQTMYGDPAHPPEPADVVAYLEWCRSFGRGFAGLQPGSGK
jgi:hypothetical protein